MKASQRALTLIEVVFVIAVLFFFWAFFIDFNCNCARAHEEARKANCKENLDQIGKAIAAYREDNGSYFPFSWQRAGEPEPTGTGAGNGAMAATSLGCLYPRYVQKAQVFRCASTEDQSSFLLNLPLEYRTANPRTFRSPPEGSNYTLTGNQRGRASSYGYDPRISPRAPGGLVVAADTDGSYSVNHDTSTQNHDGGQNILYVDGSVKWQGGNYVSTDPLDNIFEEGGYGGASGNRVYWDADTDSYLVDADAALSASFGEYEHLHWPQKAKP